MNSWAAAGVEYMLQYEWAITTFYPEFATELNMEQDIIKFYNDFFGYNMNEQEVAWILAAQMPQSFSLEAVMAFAFSASIIFLEVTI